jgi:HEAT repeats
VREGTLPLSFFSQKEIRDLGPDEQDRMEMRRKLKAIVKLGEKGDQRGVPVLVGVVDGTLFARERHDPSLMDLLKQAAIDALGQIGGPVALAKLTDLLKSQDPKVRNQAAHGLGESAGSQPVTELLKSFTTETDPDAKGQIIAALGKLGGRSSSDAEKAAIAKRLIQLMENSTGALQMSAINALGAVGHKSATLPLVNQIEQHLSIDELVRDGVRALGEIGDDRAVELVVIILGKHGSKSARIAAAIALGKIGGSKARSALKKRGGEETDADVKAAIFKAYYGVLRWQFN